MDLMSAQNLKEYKTMKINIVELSKRIRKNMIPTLFQHSFLTLLRQYMGICSINPDYIMQSLLGYNLLAFTHYTTNTNINVKDVYNLT